MIGTVKKNFVHPKTPLEDEKDLEAINWIQIDENIIMGLYQQPRLSQISLLKKIHGVTYMITIMNNEQKVQDLGDAIINQGIKWLNIPVVKGKFSVLKDPVSIALMREGLLQARKDLKGSNELVLIHCAHGLHRPGVFAYALLRSYNYPKDIALQLIKAMRPSTYEKVGLNRIDLAESEYIEEKDKKIYIKDFDKNSLIVSLVYPSIPKVIFIENQITKAKPSLL